jgi:alpha-1,2-mannosyltransferase
MRKWALQVKRTSQPEPAAGLAGRQPNQPAGAARRRQHRFVLAVAVLAIIPSLTEAYAVLWGAAQGFTGRALRDGLDFWAGGCLALHHQVATVFNPVAYQAYLASAFTKIPIHMWSYPPNYLLLATAFGWLPPWPAILLFEALSLTFLIIVLRLARLPWLLVAAVASSPVALENICEGQNAALITALIGGGLLLLETRPRLAGVLTGLATIKPQLGLVLPLHLLARSRIGFLFAAISAIALAGASFAAFGAGAWTAFWHVTRPAMSNVLLTGQPPDFAGGLISVFAACRRLGVAPALAIQAAVSAAAILVAARSKNPGVVLILAALASPYLHDYDLLGVTLAVALLVQNRLRQGFAPGEPLLFAIAWAGPGAMPWLPQIAHFTPLILLLLLATHRRRDRLPACDSRTAQPFLPASSAGP